MTASSGAFRENPAEVETRLAAYAELVEQSPHNLLSRAAIRELRTRHIPEALAFATMLPSTMQRLIDIGSGGGLPGVVIAISRPQLEVHLVESTRKKAKFLDEARSKLDLNVRVHAQRAEALGQSMLAGTFDAVTARAVAPLRTLIPLAVPFLRATGALYAIKGERWAEELADANSVMEHVGAIVLATPEDQTQRTFPQPRMIVIGTTASAN